MNDPHQDERVEQITGGLRRVHRPALRCSDPSLASLQSCYDTQGDDSVPNECAEDRCASRLPSSARTRESLASRPVA